MKKHLPTALLLSYLCCMPAHPATQVYKCVSSNSPIIFSDTNCPASTQQSTYNVPQPMLIPALPKHAIKSAAQKRAKQKNKTRVTVISDQSHPCGEHDPQTRRTAMVRKQVKSGMSLADIESMYGKPIKSSTSNGMLSATYKSPKGENRHVRFDQHGCVRTKQNSSSARTSKKK